MAQPLLSNWRLVSYSVYLVYIVFPVNMVAGGCVTSSPETPQFAVFSCCQHNWLNPK